MSGGDALMIRGTTMKSSFLSRVEGEAPVVRELVDKLQLLALDRNGDICVSL